MVGEVELSQMSALGQKPYRAQISPEVSLVPEPLSLKQPPPKTSVVSDNTNRRGICSGSA
jgi:hypothetical protein